jgi:NTE family protein
MSAAPDLMGLVLTGGGARAAYQVGVLKALAHIRRKASPLDLPNPFPVIVGTSAGALNAATLASHCDNFDQAVAHLVNIWENISIDQVYTSNALGGGRWLAMMSLGWALTRWRNLRKRSLLDNTPLESLLQAMVKTERLQPLMQAGHLQALAITASSYTSGRHVTFYDAVQHFQPWSRSQRIAVRDHITIAHLLASAAIPFLFPPVALPIDQSTEYFGDGSMRQLAPISPAIHLGAKRILVIGSGRLHEPFQAQTPNQSPPNVAQIAGHALSSIFLDSLALDIERLQRINNTVNLLPPDVRQATGLHSIDLLVIAPTQRLDELAIKHLDRLPSSVDALLRSVGVSTKGRHTRGLALASYVLFESSYTQELIDLGFTDTMGRLHEVELFFGWGRSQLRQGIFVDSASDSKSMGLA